MDFRFDVDETDLIAVVAKLMERHFPLSRFRESTPTGGAWPTLAADGWLDLPVGSEGPAMPFHLQAACAREAGRALNVEPWVNNAFLLPRLVDTIDGAATRAEWAARRRSHPGFLLADGRAVDIEVVVPGADRSRWCYGVAEGFDAYLVTWADHDVLELVCVRRPELHIDTVGDLALDVGVVTLEGGERVTAGLALDLASLAGLVQEATLVHSAALVGLAERAAAETVGYVKERRQFGVPIGQFQALQHILADVHVTHELAWNSVLYAALRGRDDPWGYPASRIQACEASLAAAKTMLQLHGGIGFTWEADVHYFLKTAATGVARFGSPDEHASALGRSLVDAR